MSGETSNRRAEDALGRECVAGSQLAADDRDAQLAEDVVDDVAAVGCFEVVHRYLVT